MPRSVRKCQKHVSRERKSLRVENNKKYKCRLTIFYLVITYFALSRVNWNSSHSSSCKAHKQLYKDWWNPWIVSEPTLWAQDWSFNTPWHTHLFLIWLSNSITVRSQKSWWVEKTTLNVKCLAQEHNAITLTSAWTKPFSISSTPTFRPLFRFFYRINGIMNHEKLSTKAFKPTFWESISIKWKKHLVQSFS